VLIALVFVLVGAAMLAFGLARWRITSKTRCVIALRRYFVT